MCRSGLVRHHRWNADCQSHSTKWAKCIQMQPPKLHVSVTEPFKSHTTKTFLSSLKRCGLPSNCLFPELFTREGTVPQTTWQRLSKMKGQRRFTLLYFSEVETFSCQLLPTATSFLWKKDKIWISKWHLNIPKYHYPGLGPKRAIRCPKRSIMSGGSRGRSPFTLNLWKESEPIHKNTHKTIHARRYHLRS